MGAILGDPIADAWYEVLTKREFSYRDRSGIVYRAGQPMGALSSWPIFALSHHVVVQMAAKKARPSRTDWFAKYIMIGDDIAIFDPRVAEAYREILEYL